MRKGPIIATFVAAAVVGLVLGGRETEAPTVSKGKKPPGKKPILVGPRTRADVAAELARVNGMLRAHGVDIDVHDAYELLRMSKGKQAPDGSRYVAIPVDEYVHNLGDLFAKVVQPIEAMLGRPVTVRGAYRAPDYNLAVGGAKTSDHIRGRAADLDLDDVAALKLAQAKFYVTHPDLPLEFGWYAGNTHVGLGGDHETYSSTPGEDDKWLAKARKELGIA